MYPERFAESLKAVEAARENNIKLEPRRMTAQEKEDLLKAYHPDYKEDQFTELKIGPNKGEKVPVELAAILQAHSRITADSTVAQHLVAVKSTDGVKERCGVSHGAGDVGRFKNEPAEDRRRISCK